MIAPQPLPSHAMAGAGPCPAPAAAPVADREGRDCLCGSGTALGDCCGPLLAGSRPARTPEELMRSRFTAFALGDVPHLLRTWHPGTRPAAGALRESLAEGPRWHRLVVHEVGTARDGTGIVLFTAVGRAADGSRVRLRERSRFERSGTGQDRRWAYVDGDIEG